MQRGTTSACGWAPSPHPVEHGLRIRWSTTSARLRKLPHLPQDYADGRLYRPVLVDKNGPVRNLAVDADGCVILQAEEEGFGAATPRPRSGAPRLRALATERSLASPLNARALNRVRIPPPARNRKEPGTGNVPGSQRMSYWRRRRDSNPRTRGYRVNGFRDRRIQPLCHPSAWGETAPDREARGRRR